MRRKTEQGNKSTRVLALCGGMVVFGGLERMVFEVLRLLRNRQKAVHCIVNDWENHRLVAQAEAIGASWSTGFYQHRFARTVRSPLKLAKLSFDITRTCLGLIKDVVRFRPSHILTSDFKSILINAPVLIVARLLGVRVILYLQNAPPPGKFYQRVWRWGVNPAVDHFVCCSRHTERELVAHQIPKRKVSQIYNIAPTRNNGAHNGVVRDVSKVIFVGQLIPEKGLDLLLEAISLVSATGYKVKLDVVGQIDGWVSPKYEGYREKLLTRAKEQDLAGRVNFLGWREDVPALMAASGMHCAPSRPEMLEGLPLVALEAKHASTPSIVFPIGPFPEIVSHGVDGWICREVSARALADGIEFFISEPNRIKKAGAAARHGVQQFGRERFIEAWSVILEVG